MSSHDKSHDHSAAEDGQTLAPTSVSGSGSGLTNLNAANISSGTLDNARLKGIPIVRKANITYNGGTQAIYTTGTNEIVIDVYVLTTATFDGDAAIKIGDAGTNDGFLADANIGKTITNFSGEDLGLRGAYLWDAVTPNPLQKHYAVATALNAYVTQTTSTAGTATVYIVTIDLN